MHNALTLVVTGALVVVETGEGSEAVVVIEGGGCFGAIGDREGVEAVVVVGAKK